MSDACKLVGNYDISQPGCFTSLSVRCSTEIASICEGTSNEHILTGPTVQSVSASGYASSDIHVGTPGQASVSLNWMKKYDCNSDILYFIFAGEGQSSISGDIGGLATINNSIDKSCKTFNINSSSGPATIYFEEEEEHGYGLSYVGGPISFKTEKEGTEVYLNLGSGVSGYFYLQSFNLSTQPGELPVANYNFVRGFSN